MADVRARAPPILYYTAISVVLLGVVVARALDRYQNFFAAAFALSHSNGSILVMANMGILCLYLVGRATQMLFFGPLRPVEIERLYQRGGFFVTDFMLAFATFREAFGVSSGVLVAVLLFIKCFHWLLADRIEAIDQVPYPGPGRLEHARMVALFLVLWIVDLVLLTYSIDAAMQQGMGLIVLFATEYAILMVNLTQCLLKYILSLFEIRRAAALGGPLAPSWEEKPIYGFYIELSTTFIELLIYVSYFVTMSIFHSIPVYAIRDVYVSGSLFFSRTLAFIRYKRALRALDVFPTPTHEELESKSDRTCIVCREELILPNSGQPAPNTEDPSSPNRAPSSPSEPDMSNGPPKRLPCGHIFHLNCLRSWFERQLTCPTCRTRVDETQARGPNAAGGAGRVEGLQGGQGGDNARPQQPGVHQDAPGADGARQGGQNRNGGRQGDATANPAVQMREPLRFEGFYLQPGAYVPWVGGPIIPRDPTISPAQQLQRIANGLQQRPRHTPLPSTSSTVNYSQIHPGSSATPVPPTVQSPTSTLNPGTPNISQSWPTATAASSASPIPDKIIRPSATPKRASVALASDGETSSDESSEENSQSMHERRRIMAEAALKRHQASFSRLHSAASNPGTPPRPSNSITPLSPADHSTVKSPTEQVYNKYFALPQEPALSEGTTPTQQWKPYIPNSLRSQITPTPSLGQYTVRNDAPSFIPLFHQFHIPVYGPATGAVRAWPHQSANLASQTLPLPSIQNPSTPAMTRPGSYRDSRSPSITASLPQAVQHPNSSINPSLLRASSSLPPRDIKREASPTQELSLRQLDVITRQLVEERLRVLENVKRITQQCIDDLTAVRGSAVSLETLRPGQTSNKPLTEQDSGSPEAVGGFSGTPIESTPPLAPLLSPTSKTDDLLINDFPRTLEPIQSPGVIPPTPLEPVEPLLASKELEQPGETIEPPTVVEDEVRVKEESDHFI